ncbi:Crp/Fnr family transcriptional regulator [Algoriphagus halophilus]|uniref:cAMP-binding domain of CRP or a regulatory subunit of cAMP-dependent protein kinases n=1 Tax=Algoriphagus halophilus TaxID=226505 RepID=A0A1N6G627_9BACT|nr:Crp/Fnr family transcriptional regulator [Algoriphagus halophilus]SIO02999.1 cAMP-binding domain of CRP or a regulatory subunit of cAMP-dependent protein kinases [Algoriphagus halophilus]
MKPFDQLVAYIKELHTIEEEEIDLILSKFSHQKLKRNQILVREGEPCNFNYFVLNGSLRLYKIKEDGQELIRYFALENKFASNLTSLITNEISQEYIQSNETSEILAIHKIDFYNLVEVSPAMNKVYRNILENAYITSQKRIYNFQGMEAIERLKWAVKYNPNLLSRIPNKMIASYLGITPFTLSRIKSKI